MLKRIFHWARNKHSADMDEQKIIELSHKRGVKKLPHNIEALDESYRALVRELSKR